MDTTTIPVVFYGVPLIPVIIGLVALIVGQVPSIKDYAGILAVVLATIIGTGVLLTVAPTNPPFADILTALAWGFGAVGVHYSFVRPLAKAGTVPAPINTTPPAAAPLVDGHALPLAPTTSSGNTGVNITGPLIPPREPPAA
jgi:hypothetical protein